MTPACSSCPDFPQRAQRRDELTRHLPENWNSIVDRKWMAELHTLPGISLALISRHGGAPVARNYAGQCTTERSQAVRDRSIGSPRRSSAWGKHPAIQRCSIRFATNRLIFTLILLETDTGTINRPTPEDSGGPATQVQTPMWNIKAAVRNPQRAALGGVHICPRRHWTYP